MARLMVGEVFSGGGHLLWGPIGIAHLANIVLGLH